MSEWQPIETAPKDGTRVLVVCMKATRDCKHREGLIQADFWHKHSVHGYEGFGKFNDKSFPATHWMPCPQLPEI